MEQSHQRNALLIAVRRRFENLGIRLTDAQSLQAALAVGTRQPNDLLRFLFSSHIARRCVDAGAQVALTTDEFRVVFGPGACLTCEGGVGSLVKSAEFAPHGRSLAKALRCTIGERGPADEWNRPHSKAAIFYGLHANDFCGVMQAALGVFVHADRRRVEELAEDVDADGPDVMLLAQCILALAKTVT